MVGGFVVRADRSGHPALEQRVAWALQVQTIFHFEIGRAGPDRASLERLAGAARAVGDDPGRDQDLASAVITAQALVGGLHRPTSASPNVANRVAKFQSGLTRLTCEFCKRASGSRRPCDHDAAGDDAIVSDMTNDARCLAFITSLFGELVSFADDYYRGLFGPEGALLTLGLGTSFTAAGDVGAKTRFPASDKAPAREASILIRLPSVLNDQHLGKLPYLMFHEIFVHGPEQWFRTAARNGTPATCSLREGFVDAAAAHLIVEALATGVLSLKAYEGHDDWLALQIGQTHQIRVNPAYHRGQELDLAQARFIGDRVFDKFRAADRARLGVALAAVLTMMDQDANARVRQLNALHDAAAASVNDPSSPGYVLMANLLALHQRTLEDALAAPFLSADVASLLADYHSSISKDGIDF